VKIFVSWILVFEEIPLGHLDFEPVAVVEISF
jgi:hypothetical protein